MSIKTLMPRLTQVGAIRLGEQVPTGKMKNGQPVMRPAKLSTFRITSPSRRVIDLVAAEFGGDVKEWRNTTGPEFEVHTGLKEIAVFVPPQTIDPSYEHWGNGYRDRLCDAETEQLSGKPCLCIARFGCDFFRTAPAGQACKATTRLSLMLADVPGLGVWKLESHGWNAASELPMLADAIASATRPIPARLEIQARQKKDYDPNAAEGDQIKSKSFMVPVLHFDFVTPGQAYSNQLEAAAQKALGAGAQQALPSAPAATPALPAAAQPRTARNAAPEPAPAAEETDWLAEIRAVTSVTELNKLRLRMQRANVKDQPIVDAWVARNTELAPTSAVAKKAEPAPVADDEIVDAVIVDDRLAAMSGAQAWQAALTLAGTKGWNRQQLADRFTAQYDIDYRHDDVTDEMLVEFLGLIQNGQIR